MAVKSPCADTPASGSTTVRPALLTAAPTDSCTGPAPIPVHNSGGGPIGLGGKSHTVWKRGGYRIEIEGSPSGVQMHFQVRINGVQSSKATKGLAKGVDVFRRAQLGTSGCP